MIAAWSGTLRRPGFPSWAAAQAGLSISWTVSSIAVSWVTLVVTTDPLAVGAVFATRFIALLLFGIPAGVLADRRDRRRLVITTSVGGAAIAAVLAALTLAGDGSIPFAALLAGSFLLGTLDTLRIAAGTTYTVDLVGPALATSGLAIANLVGQLAGIGGNVLGGLVLGSLGLAAAFGTTALAFILVAAILAFAPRPEGRAEGHHETPVSLRLALTLIRRDRLIALLAISVILGEILGFTSIALIPVFTRELWGAGPDAYGFLVAMRATGAVLGLVVLVRLGPRLTTGPVLASTGIAMGIALIVFSVAPGIAIAVVPVLAFGAAAAWWDSLSQALMQRATSDAERGAAMGIWTFAVGGGPIGYLLIGALGGTIGPVATQLAFGVLMVVVAAWMAWQPRIRAAR